MHDKQNKSFTDIDLYNELNDIDKELFEKTMLFFYRKKNDFQIS